MLHDKSFYLAQDPPKIIKSRGIKLLNGCKMCHGKARGKHGVGPSGILISMLHRFVGSSNKIVSKWDCGNFQFVKINKPLIKNAQQKRTQNRYEETGRELICGATTEITQISWKLQCSYQMIKLLMRLRVGVQVGLTRRTGPQQELVCR